MQQYEKEPKSKETMKKIIMAGREILNKKDYYEAVVEEIAQHAGVAKATVFFYFKSKELLFKEILLSLIEELCELIDGIVSKTASPLKKLKEIYDLYIDFQMKNTKLFHSIRKALSDVEPKVVEIKEKLLQIGQKILPLIEEMLHRGLIKRIEPSIEMKEIIPSMLLMYASAVSSAVFFYPDKIYEIKEIFWKILLHGILNEDVSIKMEIFNEEVM